MMNESVKYYVVVRATFYFHSVKILVCLFSLCENTNLLVKARAREYVLMKVLQTA